MLFSAGRQPEGEEPRYTGVGRGFEMAITPIVFIALGWLLDEWLGTTPLLILVVGSVGVAGTLYKTWTAYDRDMRAAEAGKPWAREP